MNELAQCVKWLEDRCKQQKAMVDAAELSRATRCMFVDSYGYERDVTEAKAVLAETVAIKKGIEKFMKKCKHEARERGESV